LPTRPPICCDCSKMLAASALRSSAPRRSPRSTRLDEAPEITASGVRRSCEIEASRAFLRPSVSASTWARCACSARSARSSAIAIWPAKVSSRWNCSGRSTRRTFAGSTASTPSTACEPFKGRYTESAEGSVSVPRPAGSPWSCTHCATARSAPRSEPGELAGHGIEHRRAPLALPRDVRLQAHARGQAGDDQRDRQHDREGDEVLDVAHGEGKQRWHEEEIKRRHRKEGGGDGRAAAEAHRDQHHREQVHHRYVHQLEVRAYESAER